MNWTMWMFFCPTLRSKMVRASVLVCVPVKGSSVEWRIASRQKWECPARFAGGGSMVEGNGNSTTSGTPSLSVAMVRNPTVCHSAVVIAVPDVTFDVYPDGSGGSPADASASRSIT